MRIIFLSIAAAVAITALGCGSKSTRGARSQSVVARGPPVEPEAESERAISPENAKVVTFFVNELFGEKLEGIGASLLTLQPVEEALGDRRDDHELEGALAETLAAIKLEQAGAAILVALQPGRGVLPKVAAGVENFFAKSIEEFLFEHRKNDPGAEKLFSDEEAKSIKECSARVSLALSEIETAENPTVPKIFDMLVQLLESNEVKTVNGILATRDHRRQFHFVEMRSDLRGVIRRILREANIVDVEGLKAALDKGAAELVRDRPDDKDAIEAVMTAFKTYIDVKAPDGAGNLVFSTGFMDS